MAKRKSTKNSRRTKHKLLARLAGLIDRNALDYARQVTSLRPKSILVAVLSAFCLYSLIFAVGYYAWQEHNVSSATFERLAWMIMIPCSVVGAIAYLFDSNRRQYTVRQKINEIVREHEGPTGMLWKLEPLIAELGLHDTASGQLIALSRERQVEEIEAEDYCELVQRIFSALDDSGQRTIPGDIYTALENNFQK